MALFPTLDYINIKARYPKSVKRIEEWLFSHEELINQFVDEKDPEKSKEMFTGMLIQMDPRKLYDIFDSLGICVSVSAYQQDDDFAYYVDTKEKNGDIYRALNRHTAEVSAFHDAFEKLENQL